MELSQQVIGDILAVSEDCIKIIGLDGSLQYMSEGGQHVMEVDDFAAIKGCPWPDFWQDKGNKDAIAAIEAAKAGRASRFTGFANTAKGNRRFWDVKVAPVFGKGGEVENILSVSRDITALRNFEEQQYLLRNELSHRIKNILALVQAVASQTLRDDMTMEEAKPPFLARLVALGRAHDLLTQKTHARATLRAVADTVAEEHPGRIGIEGPDLDLSSRSALALALALHELATNAMKYGALSNGSGRVSLAWMVDKSAERILELRWIENGGPPVAEPGQKGFGSRMIERALTHYVNGTAEISYRPSGITFRLRAPLATLTED